MWLAVLLLLLIAVPIVLNQFTPSWRTPRSVSITLLDQAQQPVTGAEVAFHEFEHVLLVPLLTFASPIRTAEHHRTVTTDANGQARFTIQYERAYATSVTLNGTKLTVDYSQTSDTFRGAGHRSFPGQLPSWDSVGGVSNISHESTIIVTRNQP